eukprot:GAHX01000576.1.p1 GENE.GAHX01000576.1~~GAHX01000576.1.p1  ORF type:complete len:332 (-),score=74.22 GAHX01000576.1:31-1026(-)
MQNKEVDLRVFYEDGEPTNSYKITFATTLEPGSYFVKWYRREPLSSVLVSEQSYYIPNISDIGCMLKLKLFSAKTKEELAVRKLGPIKCHSRLLERMSSMKDKYGLKMPITIKSIEFSEGQKTNPRFGGLNDKTRKLQLTTFFNNFHLGLRKFDSLKGVISVNKDGIKVSTTEKKTVIKAYPHEPLRMNLIPNNCTEFVIEAIDPAGSGRKITITLNSTTLFDRDFVITLWRQFVFRYSFGKQSAILAANINSWYEKGFSLQNQDDEKGREDLDGEVEEMNVDGEDGIEKDLEEVRTFTSDVIENKNETNDEVDNFLDGKEDPFSSIFKSG